MKQEEAQFTRQFLTRENTMVKNINSALYEIKATEDKDFNRKYAGEIREDIKRATRNAKILRQKIVSKSGHYHDEALKPDMKEIMAKEPLILRKNIQIPLYEPALAGTIYDKRRPNHTKKKVPPITPASLKKKKRYATSGVDSPVLELTPDPVTAIVENLEQAIENVPKDSIIEVLVPQEE